MAEITERILIVGGVAGGASCAARLRRVNEKAEIIIFDKGPFVSFASCGLPYFVGQVIAEEKDLLIATPQLFANRFNIQVRLHHEVISIDRANRVLEVKNLESGQISREKYTALVLSPGSSANLPLIPGIDLSGIFTLRTIGDSRKIKEWLVLKKVKKAAVIGAGFIGLETVENLVKLGLEVSLIEMLPQVMPNLDPDIAMRLQERLNSKGVSLHLGETVTRFAINNTGNNLSVHTRSGHVLECDLVILATGVLPEVSLARAAGLQIGELGGIRVTDRLQTSDSHIWAVGDAIEFRDFITGEWCLTPLAGPASRQGRIAADVIAGREARFRGTQGTMVCEVLGLTVASTGQTEKLLKNLNVDYEKVYLFPGHHAGYFPGAKQLSMKLLFSPIDGKILGAQAVGEEGVDKRIDVISLAIQKGGTVYDLEEAELCYAPQFGAAKDPVNLAGMIAANTLRGDSPLTHWQSLVKSDLYIVDVREPAEFAFGHVEGAVNIPLGNLRKRLNELPSEKELAVYCGVGQRSYYATRILYQNGFKVRNISGGITAYRIQRQIPA
ncbi:MAG TPA: FAD-dependent oxidoreductase [Dehalococcoidales bacterium]|nr:FAD-dependent oxidoreductase [Dehalococcoidales bacterium]